MKHAGMYAIALPLLAGCTKNIKEQTPGDQPQQRAIARREWRLHYQWCRHYTMAVEWRT